MVLLRPGLPEEGTVRELQAEEIRDVRWFMEVHLNPDLPVYQRLVRNFQRPFTLILACVARPPDRLKMVLLARLAAAEYHDPFLNMEGMMWVLDRTNWYEYNPCRGRWEVVSLSNVSELSPLQELFQVVRVPGVASNMGGMLFVQKNQDWQQETGTTRWSGRPVAISWLRLDPPLLLLCLQPVHRLERWVDVEHHCILKVIGRGSDGNVIFESVFDDWVDLADGQRVARRVETTVAPAAVPVGPGTSYAPANQDTSASEGQAIVPVGGRYIVEVYQILGQDIVVPRELLVRDTHERVLCHALFRDYAFNQGLDDEEWNLLVSSPPLDRQKQ